MESRQLNLKDIIMKLNDIILPDGKKIGEKHDNCVIKYLPDGGHIQKYSDGNIYYYNKHRDYHREDGPAIMYTDGSKYWYQNGKRHRDDGPAIMRANGSQEWWNNGRRHRDDGPALIYADGKQHWYKNGKLIDAP